MAIWDIKERNKKVRGNETRGDRTILAGGGTPANTNVIEYITLSTTGNATDFGDSTVARMSYGGGSSSTRCVFAGGRIDPATTGQNIIDYVTVSSLGNAADFGDLAEIGWNLGSEGNTIKMVSAGFRAGSSATNTINQSFYASTGSTVDFGNLSRANFGTGVICSPTRGIFAGGYSPGAVNVIDFKELSSAGDAADFGDLTATQNVPDTASSSTIGLAKVGGINLDRIIIATKGNATDFGALSSNRAEGEGGSNNIRGVFPGGGNPAGAEQNTIDYITFATTGDATDFGDLTVAKDDMAGGSSGTGGVVPEDVQRPSVTYMPGSGRALFGRGYTPSATSTVNLTHIPTLGNSSDWGDLTNNIVHCFNAASSYTRLVKGGGFTQPGDAAVDVIESIEFATQGNAADFGNLGAVTTGTSNISNSTRGLVGGGSPTTSTIEYVTITTAADSADFGDLSTAHGDACGSVATSTRGIFGGGAASQVNVIEYITIAATGNTTDFGDVASVGYAYFSGSDSHGGLQA